MKELLELFQKRLAELGKKRPTIMNEGRIAELLITIIKIQNAQIASIGEWNRYPDVKPNEYGRYLVFRPKCDKMHFEVWNGNSWAYNDNNITHWCDVRKP